MYKTEREYKGYNFLVSNSELFLLKMLQNKLMFSRQLNLFGVNLWFIIILQLILWLKFSLFSSFTVIGLTGQKINGWSCSDTGSEGQKLVHLTEEWWESYQLTATVYHLRQSLSWVLSKRSWDLQERAYYIQPYWWHIMSYTLRTYLHHFRKNFTGVNRRIRWNPKWWTSIQHIPKYNKDILCPRNSTIYNKLCQSFGPWL